MASVNPTPEEAIFIMSSIVPPETSINMPPLYFKQSYYRHPHQSVLDSLAVISTRSDGHKTHGVALALEVYSSTQINLYAALEFGASSNIVVDHIHHVWRYLQILAEERDPAAASKYTDSKYSKTLAQLILVTYQYVWTRLLKQVRKYSQSILDALERMPSTLWPHRAASLFRDRLIQVLKKLFKLPVDPPSDFNMLLDLHTRLHWLNLSMDSKVPEAIHYEVLDRWQTSMNDGRDKMQHIPFRRHLDKITSVSGSLSVLQEIIHHPKANPLFRQSLHITIIPQEYRSLSINLHAPHLVECYRECIRAKLSKVDRLKLQVSLDTHATALWHSEVIPTLRAKFGHLETGYGVFEKERIPVHFECALIKYLLVNNINAFRYIGLPKAACLACWLFTRYLNFASTEKFGMHDCSRKVHAPYVFPDLDFHAKQEWIKLQMQRMIWSRYDEAWQLHRYPEKRLVRIADDDW